jgi:hypothetical protein
MAPAATREHTERNGRRPRLGTPRVLPRAPQGGPAVTLQATLAADVNPLIYASRLGVTGELPHVLRPADGPALWVGHSGMTFPSWICRT